MYFYKDDTFSYMFRPEHNMFEAASNGATASIKIVGAILVNVIAFLCLLAFLNATLTWFGDRVGIEGLTFEVGLLICSLDAVSIQIDRRQTVKRKIEVCVCWLFCSYLSKYSLEVETFCKTCL